MKTLHPLFVELVPDTLEEGILYISIEYGIAIHKCACGCGNSVETPLSPTSWKLTYDGETVSLYPSIGSWYLPCQSHYWIERNNIIDSGKWSKAKIKVGAASEKKRAAKYYKKKKTDKK